MALCKSCQEQEATSGPFCERCAGLRLGVVPPTDKEREQFLQEREESSTLSKMSQVDEVQAFFALLLATYQAEAQAASRRGDEFLEVSLPVSTTARGVSSFMLGTREFETMSFSNGPILAAIEREGWGLIHAGYVFRETGSVSRDKFLSSGQVVGVTGDIVGVYLFRAEDTP